MTNKFGPDLALFYGVKRGPDVILRDNPPYFFQMWNLGCWRIFHNLKKSFLITCLLFFSKIVTRGWVSWRLSSDTNQIETCFFLTIGMELSRMVHFWVDQAEIFKPSHAQSHLWVGNLFNFLIIKICSRSIEISHNGHGEEKLEI